MTDRHGTRRPRWQASGPTEAEDLCRKEVGLYRERLDAVSRLAGRVGTARGYRWRFRAELALAERFELLLRRLPDRAYNWLHWRYSLEDFRVRRGVPYRRRERREREALLRRNSWAITAREFDQLVSLLTCEVCEREARGLRYWPLPDVDAELARIRHENDEGL